MKLVFVLAGVLASCSGQRLWCPSSHWVPMTLLTAPFLCDLTSPWAFTWERLCMVVSRVAFPTHRIDSFVVNSTTFRISFTRLPKFMSSRGAHTIRKASWFCAESRVDFPTMKLSADMGEDGLSCVTEEESWGEPCMQAGSNAREKPSCRLGLAVGWARHGLCRWALICLPCDCVRGHELGS